MSRGREHAERRAAQAAAARKRPVKRREDIDWKKENDCHRALGTDRLLRQKRG